jgi:crotonobetainyl-CoA:carnitine CoA-transferase CaiB-like acyl-CoA transferase
LIIAVGNDSQFRALATAAGSPALADDPRFATNPARVENRVAMIAALQALIEKSTSHDWIVRLEAAGVPCGPINTIDQVFGEPQAKARNLVVEQARADLAAPVRTVANPIRMSETPVSYRHAPPAFGADTDAVLGEQLGLSAEQLAQLKASGVI